MGKKTETSTGRYTEADHLRMMQSPDEWPMWPKLPMRKGTHGNGGPELGFLVEGYGPAVYRGNVFTSVDAFVLNRIEKEAFPTFGAMYAAGWRVD